MAALFDIVGEFQQLYDMATSDDIDPEVFEGTLEALTGELEVKSAGYVAVINQLSMERDKAKELKQRYENIEKARENAIKHMKARLLIAMDAIGKKELPAGDQKIMVKNNGGVQPLEITGDVPEKFTKITIAPDNDKIREYLKDNKCDWATLKERGRHIEIK